MKTSTITQIRKFSAGISVTIVVLIGLGLPIAEATADDLYLDRYVNQIYSAAWVNRFCADAQRKVATTDLKSTVTIYESLDDFVGSDAMPWRGAEDLPFTTPQHIKYGVRNDRTHYVQGFMCKMKSADGLIDAYPGLNAARTNCATVNQGNYLTVLYSLMSDRNAPPVVINEVEFDYWRTFSGEQWTKEAPVAFAYTSATDGKLHLVGKELYVPVDIVIDFIGPEKKGVHYCQVASPEYIRDLITGRIAAPVCNAPPRYSFDPFKPIPDWDCSNP